MDATARAGQHPCFWCDRTARLTRDHVVPRACGGSDAGNIVWACATCQRDRGVLVILFVNARTLRHEAPDLDAATLRRRSAKQHRRQVETGDLLAHWIALETRRWGSSPSAALDLSLPEVPAPVLGAWELD